MQFNKFDTVQITGHFGSGKAKVVRGLLYEFSYTEQLDFRCFENVSVLVSKRFNYNNFDESIINKSLMKQSFSGLCKIQLCRIVLVEKKIGPYWAIK